MSSIINYKTATLLALLAFFFCLVSLQSSFLTPNNKNTSRILGTEDEVNVSAYIRVASLSFRVFPEKRIPRIGNWATYIDLKIVNCNNPAKFYTFTNIPTDSDGYGIVTFAHSVYTLDGPYKIYARGFSHLNQSYNCYNIDHQNTFIDLTLEAKELFAGETGVSYDNYINSLDMSVLINKMFTNDYKSDLNQDGKVNSLDFANQIYNLFMFGD